MYIVNCITELMHKVCSWLRISPEGCFRKVVKTRKWFICSGLDSSVVAVSLNMHIPCHGVYGQICIANTFQFILSLRIKKKKVFLVNYFSIFI